MIEFVFVIILFVVITLSIAFAVGFFEGALRVLWRDRCGFFGHHYIQDKDKNMLDLICTRCARKINLQDESKKHIDRVNREIVERSYTMQYMKPTKDTKN